MRETPAYKKGRDANNRVPMNPQKSKCYQSIIQYYKHTCYVKGL